MPSVTCYSFLTDDGRLCERAEVNNETSCEPSAFISNKVIQQGCLAGWKR